MTKSFSIRFLIQYKKNQQHPVLVAKAPRTNVNIIKKLI